ncbi:MAG: hypothetical protein M9899_08565 [Bdellovibrionaceae bacterium]|nr:hypothetical protein [Pseudobdellovibrionaceae bacterium]
MKFMKSHNKSDHLCEGVKVYGFWERARGCVFSAICVLMVSLASLSAYAEIFFEPTIGASAGKYQGASYTEMRAGAIFSMQDQFLRFETTGFHRYVDGGDNFSGADFSLQIQRWFQVTQRSLIGTRLGPGYRWASNDMDAPYLDFSLSFRHLDLFGFRVGYKLFFHELKDKDYENENMVYISFEI